MDAEGLQSNENIKFSICVPVYNVEKYLDQCIQSVINQTYQNFELILVDDGSTDNSGEICDSYPMKDARIKVFHKKNQGQIHTRKYAIENATGEFCLFLDSDDYLEKNALEKIAATINKYHCDCVVFGMARVSNSKVISLMHDKEDLLISDKRKLYRKCLFSMEYNSVCRKAVKISIISNSEYSEFYHILHGEDLIQTLDILKYSKSVMFIKDVLYNYRVNLDSVTHHIDYSNIDLINNTVRLYTFSFLNNEDVFEKSDYDDYRLFCQILFLKKIKAISLSNLKCDKKIEIFDRIKESEYYSKYISEISLVKTNFIVILFLAIYNKSFYRLIINAFKLADNVLMIWR